MGQAGKRTPEKYDRKEMCQAEHCRMLRLAAVALGLDPAVTLRMKKERRKRSGRYISLSPLVSRDQGVKKATWQSS